MRSPSSTVHTIPGKKLRRASAHADFRPGIDQVVRRGDRCFIVDRQRLYADIEIISDKLTPEKIAWYRDLAYTLVVQGKPNGKIGGDGGTDSMPGIDTWRRKCLSRENVFERPFCLQRQANEGWAFLLF